MPTLPYNVLLAGSSTVHLHSCAQRQSDQSAGRNTALPVLKLSCAAGHEALLTSRVLVPSCDSSRRTTRTDKNAVVVSLCAGHPPVHSAAGKQFRHSCSCHSGHLSQTSTLPPAGAAACCNFVDSRCHWYMQQQTHHTWGFARYATHQQQHWGLLHLSFATMHACTCQQLLMLGPTLYPKEAAGCYPSCALHQPLNQALCLSCCLRLVNLQTFQPKAADGRTSPPLCTPHSRPPSSSCSKPSQSLYYHVCGSSTSFVADSLLLQSWWMQQRPKQAHRSLHNSCSSCSSSFCQAVPLPGRQETAAAALLAALTMPCWCCQLLQQHLLLRLVLQVPHSNTVRVLR